MVRLVPAIPLEVLAIDAALLRVPSSVARVRRALSRLDGYPLRRVVGLVRSDAEATALRALLAEFGLHDRFTPITIKNLATEARAIYEGAGWAAEYRHMATRIGLGKKILHLGRRKSRFADAFEHPPGVVCWPFDRITTLTECPYDCSYCYLQLTYRISPYVRQYLNYDGLWPELERRAEQAGGREVVFNLGELADALAVDPITEVVPEINERIRQWPNLKLMLLTKSGNAHHLPDLRKTGQVGQVIFSASLTTEPNRRLFEPGTATIDQRIEALAQAAAKGYAVRCRIDPIITVLESWQEDYQGMIAQLFRRAPIEMVTMGQLRFFPALLRIAKARHPEAGAKFEQLAQCRTVEGRRRADELQRMRVYRTLQDMAERHKNGRPVWLALCKEEGALVRSLKARAADPSHVHPRACNCMGLADLPKRVRGKLGQGTAPSTRTGGA